MEARGLVARYEVPAADERAARELAAALAVEATVEMPPATVPEPQRREWMGEVVLVEPTPRDGRWRVDLALPVGLAGPGAFSLVNLLMGNVSMLAGVRLVGVEWPADVLAALPGPRYGVAGLRELLPQARERALAATALKPVGLDARALAARCGAFARGGIDLVKDDHSLVDQPSAPFAERVARCQEAVLAASAGRGCPSLYVPHVAGPPDEVAARLERCRSLGIRALLVSPFLSGFGLLAGLARSGDFVLLAHPTGSGTWTGEGSGITAPVLFGELLRLLGADAVIFPNVGGRFPAFDAEVCRTIAARLREPLGEHAAAWPVPAGGIDARRIAEWRALYGAETVFLVGGSLYAQGDLEAAARDLVAALA